MIEKSRLTIQSWLHSATIQLVGVGIGTAKLDAEIILAHTIRQGRTYLHAHDDELLSDRLREIADARLELRLNRTPIAYIIGHKEFYGRQFQVTTATLIPRPESEMIITILKSILPNSVALLRDHPKKLIDVGTGSGCLGITTKLEFPELDVSLLDISRHALRIAELNAQHLNADVTLLRSDLLTDYPLSANYIVANLPYVDPAWERSPETNYEPAVALFAGDHGLGLITSLLEQVPSHLLPGGVLLLEADPRQHASIIRIAKNHGLRHVATHDFIVHLQQA
ncbi:MAG: peptide chain release factor N(5)-glutamine methyltransferase [Candidatus Saccharimonadales bacterium]